jgi:hypothetical protein
MKAETKAFTAIQGRNSALWIFSSNNCGKEHQISIFDIPRLPDFTAAHHDQNIFFQNSALHRRQGLGLTFHFHYRWPSGICVVSRGTGRVDVERDFIGAQVPLNEIELAIARWKEEEQTSTTTFVAISELVVLMVILVW